MTKNTKTRRLPIPGKDDNVWGFILNSFLLVAHTNDGNLKSSAIKKAGAVTNVNGKTPDANGQLTLANEDVQGSYSIPETGIPTADLDTQVQNAITSARSAVQSVNGKTGQNISITASDIGAYAKPSTGIPASDMASSVQTNLNAASTAVQLGGDLGGTNTIPIVTKLQGTAVNAASPTNNQVLSYSTGGGGEWVPATVSSTTVNDATSSAPGIIQLDGDLGNTATTPQVVSTHLVSALPVNQGGTGSTTQNFVSLAGDLGNTVVTPRVESIQGVSISGTPSANQVLMASSNSAASWATPPFISIISPSGDTSGVADTAAITAAITAAGSEGGTIWLEAGNFYWIGGSVSVTNPGVFIQGAGINATFINAVGTGDTFRMYWSGTYSPSNTVGGGITNLTLDGTNTTAPAAGIHMGDIESMYVDVVVRKFTGTGSIGAHFDNQYNWTERLYGRVRVYNCQNGVVFDVSSNSGSSPYSSTDSFARLNLEVYLTQSNANYNGVVVANGALPYDGRLLIEGNFVASSSSLTANPYVAGQNPAVLTIAGQMPTGHTGAGAYSRMYSMFMEVGVECPSGTYTPATIIFGAVGNNCIRGWTGKFDFDAAGKNFSASNILTGAQGTRGPNSFWGFGVVNGDGGLSKISNGSDSPMATFTQPVFYSQGSGNYNSGLGTMDCYIRDGDFIRPAALTANITINLNPGLTWSGTAGAPQRVTIILTQSSSSGPYTVTWPTNASPTTASPTVIWAGGVTPIMSTAAGAVDVYMLETYDGARWYGYAIQAQPTTQLTQVSVQTSAYSALPYQIIPVSTSSGAVTITLPNAPTAGTLIVVKMVAQTGTNAVTVASSGSDVFNKSGGSASLTLDLLDQGVILEYNSGVWIVLSDDLPLGQLDQRYLLSDGLTVSGTPSSGEAIVASSSSAAAWTAIPTAGANTFTGNQTAPAFAASGLSGATALSRYVGATTSGAPTSGTFNTGDFIIDQSGALWICTTGGTSGTWAKASGSITLDSSASDIQPTSTAAAAGSTGKAADAGHVHKQNYGGIFGSGSDGAITLNGSTSYAAFSSLAGSTYTLTRDVQATSIVVSNGVTVKTANFRIFCQGTVSGSGTISNSGNNASGNTAGGNAGTSASFISGRGGGQGATNSAAGVVGTTASFGTAGGAGGAAGGGGGFAAASGGTTTVSGATAISNLLTATPIPLLTGIVNYSNATLGMSWGGGGGGGASDSSGNDGGGGGGAGGIVAIFAWAVNFSGTISVAGGNGANGVAGNAGGGGAGSGGLIFTATLSTPTITTTNVAAGTVGNGNGTGSAGSAGGAGSVVNLVVQ